jgi:monoamine oxidase
MTFALCRVAIVGGGLSGLYAASLLEERGIIDFVVLEARDSIGGRVATVAVGQSRFDLGATWFWPHSQLQLDALIRTLSIDRFLQDESADLLVERDNGSPVRVRGEDDDSSPSMRLVGGMSSIVDALRARVDPSRLITGRTVRQMRRVDQQQLVELDVVDEHGEAQCYRAQHVLLALPPRLAVSSIEFLPPLPDALAHQWRSKATWMAPHAKYVAVFERAFWRDSGLSGSAHSARGPLGQIHDASAPGGHAALFGFFRLPAAARSRLTDDELRAHCRAQLVRLFGPQAANPTLDVIKDWSSDALTATEADQVAGPHEMFAPQSSAASGGAWSAPLLIGIGSEWSPNFSGFLAGAIDAAERGVNSIVQ